jgi:hypothetical protein
MVERCANFETCHGFIRNQSLRGPKVSLCKVCARAYRREQSRDAMRRLRVSRKLANSESGAEPRRESKLANGSVWPWEKGGPKSGAGDEIISLGTPENISGLDTTCPRKGGQ